MARVHVLTAFLSALIAFTSSATVQPPATDPTPVDIKGAARQLVSHVRALASDAKKGMAVKSISKEALEIGTEAANLIQSFPEQAPDCETSVVIKLAATGVGSHEVLTLLLADDDLAVLNGRLALSLAFLERVAQQMEDELAISTNVGPYLEAIVFGTNATSSIAETADEVVKAVISETSSEKSSDKQKNVARRQGLSWTSNDGRTSANVAPTFSGGLGLSGGLQHTSKDGRTNFNAQSALNFKDGLTSASLGLKHTFPNDRTSISVNPSWSRDQGFGIGGRLEHKFGGGRGSVFVSPSYNENSGGRVGLGFGLNFRR